MRRIFLIISVTLFVLCSRANEVMYFWSGALNPNSIVITVKMTDPGLIRAGVYSDTTFSAPVFSQAVEASPSVNNVVKLYIGGLEASTRYYYYFESDGLPDRSPEDIGSFTTLAEGAFSYEFAVGACAANSDHPVYDEMKKFNPLFYINMGDLHYENPNSADIRWHQVAYENSVLSRRPAAEFLRQTPIAYTWDDHDYSGNDSDANSPGQVSARLAYQQYVPHYPLAAGSGNVAIYQSFVAGRVRFIMTDLRSERRGDEIMSIEQKQWFYNELIQARNHNQIVAWVSSVSFSGDSPDNWGGFQVQRREISDFFKANIPHLFILSGDAHMIAIDNGDHTDFTSGFKPNQNRYPVFQVAALSNGGSDKGGIFSHGKYLNPDASVGQFGMVKVEDDGGNEICITFTGYRVSPGAAEPEILTSYKFCRDIGIGLNYMLYPNPSTGEFNLLIYNAPSYQSTRIKVRDMQGRLVMDRTISIVPGENEFQFRLEEEVGEGIYIVSFDLDHRNYSSKMVFRK